MGRKAIVPLTIYNHDFADLAKREPHARTRVRLLGLSLVQAGKSYEEIASFLNIHTKSVSNWVGRFSAEGLEGIQERPGRGAKNRFPWNRETEFKKAVLNAQEEKSGGRIKGKDVQKILLNQFNVRYSLTSVYDLLRRLDLVWISVRSKHPKQDQEVQEDFKKLCRKCERGVT